MKPAEIFRMVLAIALIAGIGLFLLLGLKPFYGGLLGAIVFFFIFAPLQRSLIERYGLSRIAAATVVIVVSILLVVVPLVFLLNTVFVEISRLAQHPALLNAFFAQLNGFARDLGLQVSLQSFIDSAIGSLQSLLGSAIRQVSQGVLSFTILYFAFYYLLINADKVEAFFIDVLPFSVAHSRKLYNEFRRVTYATLISTGVVAILQGAVLTFFLLGARVPGAFFWGAVGAVFSFLPIIGVTVIYLVIAAAYALTGSYTTAIVLAIAGLVFGNADNFVRAPLAQRFGHVHPLVTILGLFIGVPAFGLFGVVIGPLLLSYFLLMLGMFKEEYVPGEVSSVARKKRAQ